MIRRVVVKLVRIFVKKTYHVLGIVVYLIMVTCLFFFSRTSFKDVLEVLVGMLHSGYILSAPAFRRLFFRLLEIRVYHYLLGRMAEDWKKGYIKRKNFALRYIPIFLLIIIIKSSPPNPPFF